MPCVCASFQNDLTLTLCAIYDYFGLLLRALASPSKFMLQALCGPAGTHDEPDPLLSTAPFSHCSPLERVCEEVCTFASTQYQFIEQPWYGCYTCGMTSGRGVCHLCAQLCHAGHDLVFNTTGDFFCDCAAEFGVLGKCCSVTRRLGRHGCLRKPNSSNGSHAKTFRCANLVTRKDRFSGTRWSWRNTAASRSTSSHPFCNVWLLWCLRPVERQSLEGRR
ncbi:unnamed protein product [Mesocestoides corti]|uniref:UBR-type domain-containing protein n=1 Tax=Mesocestoides corti TaxID=53468 RepID=A0A0R3U283_MESCO|nr:unnamed protein product [Mesocestoides corti]